MTTGGFMGDAKNEHVVTSEFHPQMNNAVMISNFGGVYGENFEITFKVKTPSKKDVDGAGKDQDPNAGFFFRQRVSHDLYSGIYARIQADRVTLVNDMNNKDADAKIPDLVIGEFKDTIAPSTTLQMRVAVQNDTITVELKDEDGKAVTLVKNKGKKDEEEVTSLSVEARNAYDPKHVAGFAGEHMTAVFSDIVMKSGAKEFLAYPFDPEKGMELADLEISGTGMKRVALEKGNAEILKEDEDLIGSFPFILYADYDTKTHDVQAALAGGAALPSGLKAVFEYRVAPNWEYAPWVAQRNAGRHGMAVSIADDDGYVYARVAFAYKIVAKQVQLTGVTATDRKYDGTAEVQLAGGTLSGILAGDEVTFKLGLGVADKAGIGENIPVTVSTATLAGKDAANYVLTQPEGVTVNIAKGKAEAPEGVFIEGKTASSITVEQIFGAEYSLDGIAWQEENVFENLSAGKEYTVYVRIAADENQEASEVVQTTVKTDGKAASRGGNTGLIVGLSVGGGVLVAAAVVVFLLLRRRPNRAK